MPNCKPNVLQTMLNKSLSSCKTLGFMSLCINYLNHYLIVTPEKKKKTTEFSRTLTQIWGASTIGKNPRNMRNPFLLPADQPMLCTTMALKINPKTMQTCSFRLDMKFLSCKPKLPVPPKGQTIKTSQWYMAFTCLETVILWWVHLTFLVELALWLKKAIPGATTLTCEIQVFQDYLYLLKATFLLTHNSSKSSLHPCNLSTGSQHNSISINLSPQESEYLS